MTPQKLSAPIESGKGVEYPRLLDEAGKRMQATKEAADPTLDQYRDRLDRAAQGVEGKNLELQQNPRDLSAGRYSSMRGLSSFLIKGKLSEQNPQKRSTKATDDFQVALEYAIEIGLLHAKQLQKRKN